MSIKIFLVEDEPSLREMVQMNLELEGYDVSCLKDGNTAMERISELGFSDLVILDVMLPHHSGLEICEAIRRSSAVPILFLSAKGTTSDKIEGLKKGGNDYLGKPFDLEELLLRVKVLTEPARLAHKNTLQELVLGNKVLNFETFTVLDTLTNETDSLSKKEIDLLRFFLENEDKVVSRDEILDNVWGKDVFPTSRTIDNFILHFRKLFEEDPKNPRYFHSIRSVGYRFTQN
jgi:two-component system alkaline phosphatase synthesis response regulator PhoP